MNKHSLPMKFMGLLLFFFFYISPAKAQFLRTSYFMEGAHYRMQLNPSLLPRGGYFNLPVIGSLNLTAGSTSLTYQDIMDIIDNGDSFYLNPKFMGRLKDKNTFNVNVSTEILSAGWYKGKNFWSVHVGLRSDVSAELKKSMFTLLNELNTDKNKWRKSHYDISGQQLNTNNYAELGVGYARMLNSRLSVGIKAKALLGIGNMKLNTTKVTMNSNLPSDARIAELRRISAADLKVPGQAQKLREEIESYYANLVVDAHMESSFKGLNLKGMKEKGYIDDIEVDRKNLGIAGYGLGVDLGFSYKLLHNLTLSASVIDLGVLSWSKKHTQTAVANPEDINLKGSDYLVGIPTNLKDAAKNPQQTLDAVQANMNRFQQDINKYKNRVSGEDVMNYEMLQLQTVETTKSRTSRLSSTLVLGAEYGLFANKLGIGVLSTTRFIEPKAYTELTFSANYRPKNWFNATLSYSVIQTLGKSFGLGLKLGPVFVGSDYMFLGKNSNYVNGFIGVSIPLGGKNKKEKGKG